MRTDPRGCRLARTRSTADRLNDRRGSPLLADRASSPPSSERSSSPGTRCVPEGDAVLAPGTTHPPDFQPRLEAVHERAHSAARVTVPSIAPGENRRYGRLTGVDVRVGDQPNDEPVPAA